jgi:hypothetical protein
MSLLARAEITPFYGQVELSDPAKRDYPQFQTGTEKVVAIPDCIVVATRGDLEGPVVVEVWDEPPPAAPPGIEEAYAGELVVTGPEAVVGNTVGNEFHLFPVEAGRYRVQVFTSPPGAPPNTVYFVLQR